MFTMKMYSEQGKNVIVRRSIVYSRSLFSSLFVHQILCQLCFQFLQGDLALQAGVAEVHGAGGPDGEGFFGHVAAANAGMVGLVGPLEDLQGRAVLDPAGKGVAGAHLFAGLIRFSGSRVVTVFHVVPAAGHKEPAAVSAAARHPTLLQTGHELHVEERPKGAIFCFPIDLTILAQGVDCLHLATRVQVESALNRAFLIKELF